HMVQTQMRDDNELLVQMFREVGEPEFRFVVNSGLYFGFLFGLIQLPIFIYYPQGWILPVGGLLIGAVTNWLALNIIFRPVKPIAVGPLRIQGLFLKRQKDVAENFARLTTEQVVTLQNIMQQVVYGPRADRTKSLVKRHLRPLLDRGVVRTAAQLTVGTGGYGDLKKSVDNNSLDFAVVPFEDPVFNCERGAIVERIMRERMQKLSAEEFQVFLRPAFEEYDWILMTVR